MVAETFKAGALHKGLDLKFKLKIDEDMFNKLDDRAIVVCWENLTTCRKFMKGFLTLTDLSGVPTQPTKKRKVIQKKVQSDADLLKALEKTVENPTKELSIDEALAKGQI